MRFNVGGEIRQNKATNQWVIFAPSRRRRPHDFARPAKETAPPPAHDPDCPFCPGNEAKLTLNPFEGAQTMTGYIAQIASGDAPQGSPVYYSLFAVGALLFVMTLVINLISIRLVRRFRQVY